MDVDSVIFTMTSTSFIAAILIGLGCIYYNSPEQKHICYPEAALRVKTGCDVTPTSVCIREGCFLFPRIASYTDASVKIRYWTGISENTFTVTSPLGVYCIKSNYGNG